MAANIPVSAEKTADIDIKEQKKTAHNSSEVHSENSEAAHAQESESGIFTELLGELGDHQGFYIGPHKISELPYIIVDDGFHFYTSKKSMEQEGLFTATHHGVVRTADHEPPALDLSLTNLVVFQWIAMILILFVVGKVGKSYKKNSKKAPKGLQNLIEATLDFVKDEIVVPNIPSKKAINRLVPYFFGLFLFILVLNLLGLVPGGHTATGSITVTAALSLIAFIVIQATAIKESGIKHWFEHLLGGAPWFLAPLMVPIEIIGMLVKPFALTVRLFANMTAGHVVLFALIGLLFLFETVFLAVAIVPFSVFILFLEVLVAFIQAYIFTMLTAIFVGLAIGEHAEEEHFEEVQNLEKV